MAFVARERLSIASRSLADRLSPGGPLHVPDGAAHPVCVAVGGARLEGESGVELWER